MRKDELNVRKLTGPTPEGKRQEGGSYLFKACGAEFSVYKCGGMTHWCWSPYGVGGKFIRFFNKYTECKTKWEAVVCLEECLRKGFYVSKEIPEDMNLAHYALLRTEKALMEKLEKTRAKIKEYESDLPMTGEEDE